MELLKLSNFQCWPEGKGWANEDDLLVTDVLTWLAVERRAEWEAQYGIEDEADIIPLETSAPRYRMDQL